MLPNSILNLRHDNARRTIGNFLGSYRYVYFNGGKLFVNRLIFN